MERSIYLFTILSVLFISCEKEKTMDEGAKDNTIDSPEESINVLPDTNGLPTPYAYFEYAENQYPFIKINEIQKTKISDYFKLDESGFAKLEQNFGFKFKVGANAITNDSLSGYITFYHTEQDTNILNLDKSNWNYHNENDKFNEFFKNMQLGIMVEPNYITHSIDYEILSIRKVFNQEKQYCEIHFKIETEMFHPDKLGSEYHAPLGGDDFHHQAEIVKGEFKLLLD